MMHSNEWYDSFLDWLLGTELLYFFDDFVPYLTGFHILFGQSVYKILNY